MDGCKWNWQSRKCLAFPEQLEVLDLWSCIDLGGSIEAKRIDPTANREGEAMSVLRADGVTVKFGGLVAVQDVHFTVKQGEIYAVIGPNGAGKTTLFNAVTGIYAPLKVMLNSMGERLWNR